MYIMFNYFCLQNIVEKKIIPTLLPDLHLMWFYILVCLLRNMVRLRISSKIEQNLDVLAML